MPISGVYGDVSLLTQRWHSDSVYRILAASRCSSSSFAIPPLLIWFSK